MRYDEKMVEVKFDEKFDNRSGYNVVVEIFDDSDVLVGRGKMIEHTSDKCYYLQWLEMVVFLI